LLLLLFFLFLSKNHKRTKKIKKSTSAKGKESHSYGESKHKEENDMNIKSNQNQKGSSSFIHKSYSNHTISSLNKSINQNLMSKPKFQCYINLGHYTIKGEEKLGLILTHTYS
jgi:hypothetical protein